MSLQAYARTIARGWVGAIVLAAFSAASTPTSAFSTAINIATQQRSDLTGARSRF